MLCTESVGARATAGVDVDCLILILRFVAVQFVRVFAFGAGQLGCYCHPHTWSTFCVAKLYDLCLSASLPLCGAANTVRL